MLKEKLDEILEQIWILKEKGKISLINLEQINEGKVILENLKELRNLKLIETGGEHLTLTETGRKKAEEIIRRHRLAERLLADLFELDTEEYEATSCQFEHILSENVTERICSFLGHPPLCPHGKHIPRGECCHKLSKKIEPLITPLGDLEPGYEGKIHFISTHHHGRLEKLSSLGISPGKIVKLIQARPAFVIKVEETEIALDKSIISEIYVKPQEE
ncbi:MAG: metal-dependent transcriptional regulator [Armatimonadetes bacterium]|nr:metal-dependent transcriptional regulator [Armatimonadota bacterium]